MSDQAAAAPSDDGATGPADPFESMMRHRTFRWRVSMALLIVLLVGGCLLIGSGVSSDAVAARIDKMSGIIGSFMFAIVGLLSALFGFGAIDNRTSMYGSGYGNRFASARSSFNSSRAD